MRSVSRIICCGLIATLALAGAGCSSHDQDCLLGMSRKVAEKAEQAVDKDSEFMNQVQAMRANLDEMAVESRVAARIRWDSGLADCDIEVFGHEGTVQLKGTVSDGGQRVRAVDLARSTVGVEDVIDSLSIRGRE